MTLRVGQSRHIHIPHNPIARSKHTNKYFEHAISNKSVVENQEYKWTETTYPKVFRSIY